MHCSVGSLHRTARKGSSVQDEVRGGQTEEEDDGRQAGKASDSGRWRGRPEARPGREKKEHRQAEEARGQWRDDWTGQ